MTTTPAPAGLDALDALLTAATPGEWRWEPNFGGPEDSGLALTNDAGVEIVGAYNEHCCDFRIDPSVNDADAALIVALRNRAPAMLAAIRAAYALAKEMEDEPSDRTDFVDAAFRLRCCLDEALGVEK